MGDLRPLARMYIVATVLLAVGLFCWAVPTLLVGGPSSLISVAAFSLAVFVADLYPIRLVTDANAEVTVSCAFKTAAAILFGIPGAIIATMVGTLLAEMAVRRTWYKAAFNAAEMVLTMAAMGAIYRAAYDGVDPHPFHSVQNLLAVTGMVITYLVLNTGLVTGIVSLASGVPFMHVWQVNFLDSLWNNLTIIPLGAVFAALYAYQPWSVFALVLPLVVMRKSFHYIAEFRSQTQDALIHMADAIDQRDPSTFQHSQRVAEYAQSIAATMGLVPEHVETVRMAGRLHDIGKIGMSNDLLLKPGALDPDERALFQRHPVIGADLVNSFQLFEEGQHLIRHHHERFDGEGYPSGLRGEDIPLGSRILAVADAYDAMTSHRPYRGAMTRRAAMDELVSNRGTQFDPQVVAAFLTLLGAERHLRTPQEPIRTAALL